MADEIIFSDYQAEIFEAAELLLKESNVRDDIKIFADTYVLNRRLAQHIMADVPEDEDSDDYINHPKTMYNTVLGREHPLVKLERPIVKPPEPTFPKPRPIIAKPAPIPPKPTRPLQDTEIEGPELWDQLIKLAHPDVSEGVYRRFWRNCRMLFRTRITARVERPRAALETLFNEILAGEIDYIPNREDILERESAEFELSRALPEPEQTISGQELDEALRDMVRAIPDDFIRFEQAATEIFGMNITNRVGRGDVPLHQWYIEQQLRFRAGGAGNQPTQFQVQPTPRDIREIQRAKLASVLNKVQPGNQGPNVGSIPRNDDGRIELSQQNGPGPEQMGEGDREQSFFRRGRFNPF